jgi:nitrite reductase/ring-hydroxylating ferredoxin subunit
MKVRVCQASDIPAGGMKAAEVDGHPLLVANGGKFSLETGEALEFPAEDPLPIYPVTLAGGELYVDLPGD